MIEATLFATTSALWKKRLEHSDNQDHTKPHKAAAVRHLAAAQLNWSCQQHTGARSVLGQPNSVYLLQLTASEIRDRAFCDAPAHAVRVHRTRERRADRRRSTMKGTPSSRDARVNALLGVHAYCVCNMPRTCMMRTRAHVYDADAHARV